MVEAGEVKKNRGVMLVGISGKKRHGKDTVCRMLGCNLGGVKRMAFADALKEEVATACQVTLESIEEHKEKFRPMLQWWGTEFRRKFFGENYWLNRLREKIAVEMLLHPEAKIVVTDVRFPNEAELIHSMGGVMVRVQRNISPVNGLSQESRVLTAEELHPSETALDHFEFDYHVKNHYGLAELELEV